MSSFLLNVIGTNNGHAHNTHTGTQVSSRKGGVKGKTVSCVNNKNNSKNSSKNNNNSNSLTNSTRSGYSFLDPSKNPPIMSFPQGPTQKPVGTAQGASAFNPGAYSVPPTPMLPP